MKSQRTWGGILALFFIIGLLFWAKPLPAFGQEEIKTPEVEPELLQQIQSDSTTGYLIYFHEKADLSAAYDMGWEERGEYVVKALQETAYKSQAEVIKYLNEQKVDYQAFWIDNVIAVNGSSQTTFNGLMDFSEIEFLRTRRMMEVIEPTIDENTPEAVTAVEPNISHVLAPDVWGLGITGSGIVVANIDTGVRSTHDALVRQYRGTATGSHDYNWLGAANGDLVPTDDHGHGTHTMGTMVGEDATLTNQIGMAPGAQWIACDACTATSGCPDVALLTCAQWVVAPYPIGDPGSLDASMRPNAVNNSWGDCGQTYDNWYQASVDAWLAAGIYPIFSNGNASNCGYSTPPGLNTVGNPARYGNVTGVGSTGESNGQYAPHSNWGPTDNLDTVNPTAGWADLKPQVLAPGVSIRSSTPGSDSDYQDGWSGTSMSAPHVTGLVALMWQAAPCLLGDYAATETIIEETATPIYYDDGSGARWPNYATGWGEIDALAAVQAAQGVCGSTLTGTVTDATSMNPLAGVLIQAENISYTFQTTTDSNGVYAMGILTGTYDVTASLFGYLLETVSGVFVAEAMTTTVDFALPQATMYTVSGTVTDATTGWPLYASIDIDGYPGDPIWTNPETGYYEVSLPEGVVWSFDVEAWVLGYEPIIRDVGPLTGNTTEDFGLDVNVVTCTAPGYDFDVIGVMETFEDVTTPSGWTVVNNGGDCPWAFDDPGSRGNLAGGTGNFAVADSDSCGFGTTMDTTLLSPIVDVSSLATVNLEFKYDYNNLSSSEIAAVDISSDGGATWTNLVTWNSDQRGPATFSQDVTAEVGGSTQAQLRFSYYAPGWYWWWEVDDVLLGETNCLVNPGGLVVGNVNDNNTMDALNGAMVENEGGFTAEAVATPLDDNVADGFYTLFSPAGSQVFTATMTGNYGAAVETVSVVSDDAVWHDFNIPAGWLVSDPESLSVAVNMGLSTTLPLTLTNLGDLPIEFEIKEQNDSFSPALLNLQSMYPYQKITYWDETETASLDLLNRPTTWDSGSSIPTGPRYRSAGTSCDGSSFYVFGGSSSGGTLLNEAWNYDPAGDSWTQLADLPVALMNFEAACIDDMIYLVGGYDGSGHTNNFQIYDVASNSWTATTWAKTGTPTTAVYNGKLYAFTGNPGPSTDVYVFDPIAVTWTMLAPIPTAISYPNAITVGDYMFVIGGANSNAVQRYDPVADVWDASGPQLQDSRMSALSAWYGDYIYVISGGGSGGDVWTGWNTTEVYDPSQWPSGAWVYDDENVATPVVGPAGDCSSDSLWVAGGTSGGTTYDINQQLDDGMLCNFSISDIPWLSEDPITGTIPSLANLLVDITFDASIPEIDQPGDYTAELSVGNDTPYGPLSIPVTMTVPAPVTWGELSGNVSTMGYCDSNYAPLEEAQVLIESSTGVSMTLLTDANGDYSYWFDEALSPFTITVSMDDEHETIVETGESVVAGQETTLDFDLRWIVPCAGSNPTALEVDLVIGYTTTLPLTITNMGGMSMTFDIEEIPGSFTPVAGYLVKPLLPLMAPTTVETLKQSVTIGDLSFGHNPNSVKQISKYQTPTYAPDATTITHSASQTITAANSVACNNGISHTDNSYLRTFTLSDFGINQDFNVTNVEIGIESSSAGSGGSQPAVVNLYTLNGVLQWANLTLIGTANVNVADQDLTILNMPIAGTVPAGGTLVVEFFTPDGSAGSNLLFVGSNSLGQTAPTYLAAADCTVVEPMTTDDLGFPEMQLVMNVTGEIQSDGSDGSPVPWLKEDPGDGIVLSDSSQDVIVTFEPLLPQVWQVGTYTATLNINNSDSFNDPISIPVTMNVIAPEYGLSLEQSMMAEGKAGETVTYELTLTNLSNTPPDSFVVVAGAHTWATTVDSTVVGPLEMGETATITVEVVIPVDAPAGVSDTVQITAYSSHDLTKHASVTLVTSTHLTKIYMPIIVK